MARSIRDLLQIGTSGLSADSATDAHLEASILLAHLLGKPRSWLFAHPEEPVDAENLDQFRCQIKQRADGTPMAYLTGEREFWSLPLRVTRDTLIPRPETELLVERALSPKLPAGAMVADLGTGSGAVAAALASERPLWTIVATDTSEAALGVAAGNFHRLGLSNIECRQGRWLQPLRGERFDLLVSNPPYIQENDPHLAQGDVKMEPRLALASGTDGLDALREILSGAASHLQDGGRLIVEHGYDQADKVRELFESCGFSSILTHRDLAGHDRVTEGCRDRS